jgi:hypothetical protein
MRTLSLFAALVIALSATACHQQLMINQVPPPVRASFEKEAADGGQIGEIQKRQKHGQQIYLAEIKDKTGKWWDVQVAADGTVVQKD